MDYASTADEMVRRIGTIQDEVGASTCFGTPVEKNGHTVIPVARVSFGYGMGFGGGSGGKGMPGEFGSTDAESGEGGGGGGGGGGSSTPVAVIQMTGDDVVIKPINDTTRIALSWAFLLGWIGFWGLMTVRTVTREIEKTRRHAIDKKA
jgi:uncharacterized spore protein YtfJ